MLHFLKSKQRKKKNNFIAGLPVQAFNPIDANTVALWDGDQFIDITRWRDLIASYQIDFFNTPTINAGGLNGHGTVTFDGVTQYGQSPLLPVLTTPYSIYIVLKQINWTANNVFLNGADIVDIFNLRLRQVIASPQLRMSGQFGSITLVPNLSLNAFGILTMIFDGTNSVFRLNNFSRIIGSTGTSNTFGVTLAVPADLYGFVNCEFAYLIYRNGHDSNILQDNTVSWLKNRFAI